jgi:hypothetical protein
MQNEFRYMIKTLCRLNTMTQMDEDPRTGALAITTAFSLWFGFTYCFPETHSMVFQYTEE